MATASNVINVSAALSSPLGAFVDVIGVVVDLLPPGRTKGSSWVVTFTLKDSDFDQSTWRGLKIKYFGNGPDELPPVQLHDVVLLWGIRVCASLLFLCLPYCC